ncbi:MAG TPA: uroporphyrinogen-III synthase [Polyangiaceae bacterium]|nr:uroporphyrinogen-III synthase [Polyangiaceae bacterium]
MSGGLVSFVGLGPGDPRLYSERATERLAQADAVLGDDAATADKIIALGRQGRRVVRTVAGDPLESPRVVAEVLEVAGAGVPIEVVPAIGLVSAAATFAGVLGRALCVPSSAVAEAVSGTPSAAPVTLITEVGLPSQRVVVTTSGEAAEKARALRHGPVVLVFGSPDPRLRWFERRPLFGKRVLVTRAREQAGGLAALLREHGADPVVLPTIEIHAPSDRAPLARALVDLRTGAYGWVAFTSANGVDRTWDALVEMGGDARAFGPARLAAIGPATARALEHHGLRADVVATEFRGEQLAQEMLAALRSDPEAPRVLLARAARARNVLPETLRAAGYRVDVVAAYETHPPLRNSVETLMAELEEKRVDAVMFTSSSTVDNFCDLLGARAITLLGGVRVASIGPVTTETARARGLHVDVAAREYTVPGLVEALAASYA